ncbi:MAG: TIGR03013 family XrtA/PEP-CTERM system glycosyltransferase [Thermoanaerobaculia bacterium]
MFRFLNRYWVSAAVLSVVVESGLILLSVWVANLLRSWVYYGHLEGSAPAFFVSHLWLRQGVLVATILLGLYANGLYDFHEHFNPRELFIRIGRSLGLASVVLLALYYVTFGALTTGRGVFAVAMVVTAVLLTSWRLLLGWLLKSSANSDRVMIIGTDECAIDLAREVLQRKHLGFHIVGFVGDDPRLLGRSLINPRVLGTTGEVYALARQYDARRIVVAQRDLRGKLDMDQLLECKTSGILVEQGTDYYERITGKIMLEGLTRSWLIFSRGFVVSKSTLEAKLLSDSVVAAIGLVLALPLMLLTAIAIRLDSPGPVFFRQERVGKEGKIFTLWKFRSMRVDSEADGEPRWATEKDPRVTRVGRLIRKLRIDELPQLLNVLVGDMSLVGPRPERKPFVDRLAEMSPFYAQRHVVRPGLTGWAQIRAPYAASYEDSVEKLKYDLYYVKNLSFWLDASILISTVRIVLFGRGGR